jgi:AraC-like DNA-binding protein
MNKYKKLIIRNTMLICIIFSVLFSFSFYIERYTFSKQAYHEQAQNSIKTVSTFFSNSFYKFQDWIVLLHTNEDFKEYTESSNPTSNIRRAVRVYMNSTITSMPSQNSFIFATQPNDDYIIAATSLLSHKDFCEKYNLDADVVKSMISDETTTRPTPNIFFTQKGDKWYYTIAIHNDIFFNGSYTAFSVYEMDELLSTLPKGTELLISQAGQPLFCTKDFDQKLLDNIAQNKNVSGHTTIASYSSSTTTTGNLTYTMIIPKSLYFSHINRHLVYTLLSLLLLFALSLVLSRGITSKTYGPIEKLINQISDLSFEPSEDEIETISSVISLLNKRNDELNTIVSDSRTPLMEKFVNDFIHGHLSSDKISMGIDLYLPDIKLLPPVMVVVLDANFEYDITFESADNLHSYYGVIQTLFQEEFKDSQFFHMTAITPSVYGFVVSSKNIDEFTHRLKNLLLNIEIDIGISMQSTVSQPIDSWDLLPHTVLTTYYKHTGSRLNPMHKAVASIDEHKLAVMYSPELENDIYTSCVRNNREKLTSSLDLLLNENLSNASMFEEIRTQLSVLFYALCIRIFTFMDIDAKSLFGSEADLHQRMAACETSDEFYRTIHEIFNTISDAIKNIQSVDEHNYGKYMMEYIHLNYNKDISLHTLATHMNMSQAYVSRLFKKLTNHNFKDYLSNIRVEKAVELLTENPSDSIQEVAAKVGYNNAKAFTSLFIKTMGVTPSEYRKSHRDSK